MKSTTEVIPERVPFLDLGRQYERIKEEIDGAIAEVVRSSAFIGGPHVRAFEEHFAAYQSVGEVIGVGNGTDALEIVLEAMDWDREAEIIVPANSFVATSEAVSRSGYRVVFADVDGGTFNLSVADVARRVTPHTRAVIGVHLYGQPCDVAGLRRLCADRDLVFIEDAAQAHGAEVGGTRVGGFGVASTFSFYPGKNLGAFGDAGAIATNDPALGKRMRMLANHGRTKKYEHAFEGRNSRLDGLQAAVLSVKLRHLESWIAARIALAAQYREELAGIDGLILPDEVVDARHVYHLFVVRTDRRDALRDFMADRGVSSGIHYPVALPRLEAYRSHPQAEEPFVAADVAGQLVSLPIGDSLDADEVARVCEVVRAFFA